ncbi:MAG: hypothetical protein A3B13_02755 [Candidatus Liptonbacteria bacterium RIFCSPLOWO2_01_FULL_45_15]|uniref:Uncharacterized protein n=1 Tax=Candidatus Liptonbacteria bacterium RIFCSPLOWO2_01_FULL_45_15 TaxID=1798649 RepID=A0A1G2CHS0_9BACT|nr:MAG: hypothetical protein A3B13_02755 [Candidatus Liptonbacteria bacterium RIFCSPLOWO2_01_FULL_45_15]
MTNLFEKKTQDNPEFILLHGRFQHDLRSFIINNRPLEKKYSSIGHLQEGREIIDKLLATSQNDALIPVLQEIKNTISGIDANSRPDVTLLDHLRELLEAAEKEIRY